jgi:hypothetical protein
MPLNIKDLTKPVPEDQSSELSKISDNIDQREIDAFAEYLVGTDLIDVAAKRPTPSQSAAPTNQSKSKK